jgi:mannose-1-phosphate guanylyltransferase
MKAFLLAAGEGTRLRPLTIETPKCLVPIGGIPLLAIWYRYLERNGVTEVMINTHHLSDQVQTFINQLSTSIKTHIVHEPELLGSAGTLLRNRDFVREESRFWIIYADSLTAMDMGKLLCLHQEKQSVLTLGLYHTNVPKECGIVTLDETGRIIRFVEKPSDPEGDLSNTGIMVSSSDLFNDIPERIPCDLSYDVLPHLLGRMHGLVTNSYFIDIGSLERYQAAQLNWDHIRSQFGF